MVRLFGTNISWCLCLPVCIALSAGSAFAANANTAETDAGTGKDAAAEEQTMEQVREELANLDQRWYL
jgi:hypothetical protein